MMYLRSLGRLLTAPPVNYTRVATSKKANSFYIHLVKYFSVEAPCTFSTFHLVSRPDRGHRSPQSCRPVTTHHPPLWNRADGDAIASVILMGRVGDIRSPRGRAPV